MRVFEFPSSSSPGTTYKTQVSDDGRTASCNCPGWTRRVDERGARTCKHTKEVLLKQRQAAVLATPTPARRDRGANLPTGYRPQDKLTTLSAMHPSFNGRGAADQQGYVQPMLASPMPAGKTIRDFESTEYWMEKKEDGERKIVAVAGGQVLCWSRPRDGTVGNRFSLPIPILSVMAQFPAGTYDGELVSTAGGHSWNVRDAGHAATLQLVLFDMLRVDDTDLTRKPAAQRRRMLEALGNTLFKKRVATVVIAPAYPVSRTQLERILKAGGEGAILKRRDARYQPGARSADWIKVKRKGSMTCTITGFVKGKSGPYATVALRMPNGGTTTVKTKNAHVMRAFAATPAAFIGAELVIEHQGVFDGQPRHPMFDHLVMKGAARRPR